MSPVVHHDVGTCAGGGDTASGAAGWLGLAAAPTFAIMALWTGLLSGQPDILCMGMQDASPLNGMALMYSLMSAFHLGPWLKQISRQGSRARGSSRMRLYQRRLRYFCVCANRRSLWRLSKIGRLMSIVAEAGQIRNRGNCH
jgi:hypothetical protein